MKLDKLSSERLNVIRFPLIVGVVFIHASGSGVNLSGGNLGADQIGFLARFIQDFISDGIATIAVPLFFLMSGYLFFLGFKWSLEKYKSKIKSRIKTLIIPFLFWNIATMLVYFIAQTIPSTSVYFSGNSQSIATYNIFDFFNSLIGLNQYPISYQFWFIRDLIVMVFFAPLLSVILSKKNISTIVLGCLFILWFFNLWSIYIPSIAALFFFYTGAYLSQKKHDLFSIDKYGKHLVVVFLLVLVVDSLTKGMLYNSYIHNVGIVFGILTSLYCTRSICNHEVTKKMLLILSNYSFFVFAIHEPILIITKKIIYKIATPSSDLFVTAIYLLLPIMVILFAIAAYKVMSIVMPKALSIVCGGR